MPKSLHPRLRGRAARSLATVAVVVLASGAPFAPDSLADPSWSGDPVTGVQERSAALSAMEVLGSARVFTRGDTLEIVATGAPDLALRLPLPPAEGRAVEAWRLVVGASEDLWARPVLERGARIDDAGPPVRLPAGEPVAVVLRPLPTVTTRAMPRATALLLRLPPFVGRLRFVGDVAWTLSPAPLRTARIGASTATARVVAPGVEVEFPIETGPGAVFTADAAAVELLPGDSSLVLEVEAIEGGDVRRSQRLVLSQPLDAANEAHWSNVRLALDDLTGDDCRLRVRVERGPDNRFGRVALASARPVVPRRTRSPLLFVIIDTLRDEDPSGRRSESAPRLRALAREGVDFTQARANSSWTLPSTASALVGWNPSRHGLGMGAAGASFLHPEASSLFEALDEAGWITAAISANPIVAPGTGLERGFASFDLHAARNPHAMAAQNVVRRALEWLRPRRGLPWALYLHFFDPHDRYRAPDPWAERFVDPSRRRSDHPTGIWAGQPNPLRDALVANDASIEVRGTDVELLAELYRGEIAYVDHVFGALVDTLRAWGEFERSVVVVTSDHGEEFLEHGMLKHGHALNEVLLRVPLTIVGPTIAPGVIDESVGLVDLAPTLRTLLGVTAATDARVDGRDLSPFLREGRSARAWPAAPSLAELESRIGGAWEGSWRSVVDGAWKWVDGPQGEHLYRIDADPGERSDLHGRHAEIAARLRAVADSLVAGSSTAPRVIVDERERREALRSLGYIR